MDSALLGTLFRIALNSVASALVAHSVLVPEQGAYLGSHADALVGLAIGAYSWIIGLKKAATTVAVPKNDPVQAKIVANQIADNNAPGGANR